MSGDGSVNAERADAELPEHTDRPIKLTDVHRLAIEPGDVLAVTVPSTYTPQDVDAVIDRFRHHFPDIRVIICSDDVTFGVVRPDPTLLFEAGAVATPALIDWLRANDVAVDITVSVAVYRHGDGTLTIDAEQYTDGGHRRRRVQHAVTTPLPDDWRTTLL